MNNFIPYEMYILGLTHPISFNPAATLLLDGKIIAAAEEERFVRIKHAPRMIPHNAIEFVLRQAQIKYDDVDIIAISWEGPHNTAEIDNAVTKGKSFYLTPEIEKGFWIESINKENYLMNFLKKRFARSKIYFVKHHIAHAASACYVSGFDKSLFLTLDGRGEFESGIMGIYQNGEMEIIHSFSLDESLGHLYECFTQIIGFRAHTDEGKIMGLAPYGKPKEELLNVAVVKDNKIEIDWQKIWSLYNINFENHDPTKDERKDLAATAQHLLEKCVLSLVDKLTSISDIRNICLAGGSALNIDMNGSIISSGLINDIFIQPSSHDGGCSLGAALHIHHQVSSVKPMPMKHAYFGLELDGNEVKKQLDNSGLKYKTLSDISSEIASLISDNKIVGWIQGRAEFGPRALGSRSLLANPTDSKMWKTVNRVKGREYWRPLAPSIVEEESHEFFSNQYTDSPYMLLRLNVKDERIKDIPAVVHVDNSARPQTVSKNTNELYWNLLRELEKIQGIPAVINTSLNLKGEPIVNNVNDGVKTLLSSDIDYLCIDKYLVYK